ncbi:sigma factor-like helix-turn-helix DNA-binding protein [Streptomyces sp. H27-C3]|uniref:sigma factor-like helix-turn-helix DNA-binding protein n=1 Tax=Streptomyces sp. H27-C3 TaxID=3046305 RepID=UPI0024B96777|nr:sigma factor-like helix-turn-helix DNA-binding protein [Streptomyces sp. H27-C3]MDJ0465124.1 sigma factor-like helix-turn-helix DNA-binding protein [Streptomyces sp. H27-C3]
MRDRPAVQQRRRAREFEAYVAGAAGRLLHAATLLTGEAPERNDRARRLLTAALSRTYVEWERLRGEDPYDHTRQELAARFARGAWRHHHWGVVRGRALPWAAPQRPVRGGVLERLTPRERLVLVLRLYEGVAEEQTAAQLGLPVERVRVICSRAVATMRSEPPEPAAPHARVATP